jgi:hypothetical protein
LELALQGLDMEAAATVCTQMLMQGNG